MKVNKFTALSVKVLQVAAFSLASAYPLVGHGNHGGCRALPLPMVPPPHHFESSGLSEHSVYRRPEYLEQYAIPEDCKPIQLPAPCETHIPARILSLRDAILLALRNNPDVLNSELARITDKYALMIAHYAFEPTYSISGSANFVRKQAPTYNLTATTSVFTPIGTTISSVYSNNFTNQGGTITTTIAQPLLRGFGYVNIIPYLNALDNEEIAKLNFKGSTIGVVSQVIQGYQGLVQDYNALEVQRRSLKQQEELDRQNRLKVKVGKMAPSDLLQQQANLETNRVNYEQQLNILQQDYQNFLLALGILPTANIEIDRELNYIDFHIPPTDEAIRIALANNIEYQTGLIRIRAVKRAILQAQDAMKPIFNATGTQTLTGIGTTNANHVESLGLTFTVPIDNFPAKVALVTTRVAYEQSKIALEKARETLVAQITAQVANLESLKRQIRISENAVRLQEITLRNTLLRQTYGKATMFEVVQTQNDLLTQQISLINAQIAFQNAVVQFQQTLGITLEHWNIQMRY